MLQENAACARSGLHIPSRKVNPVSFGTIRRSNHIWTTRSGGKRCVWKGACIERGEKKFQRRQNSLVILMQLTKNIPCQSPAGDTVQLADWVVNAKTKA